MRERHYDQALALLRPIVDHDHEIESSPSPYTLSDEITLARALVGLHRDREARALLMPMRADVEHRMAPTHPSRIEFERLIAHFGGRAADAGYSARARLSLTPQGIGRAACSERVCQYWYISVLAVALQKKPTANNN